MTSSVSNSAASYLNQLQSSYTKAYKSNSAADTIFSGNLTSNTNNDTGLEGQVSSTQDETTLSADAIEILKNLNYGSQQSSNILTQILGGGGANNSVAQLLGDNSESGNNTISKILGGGGSFDVATQLFGGGLNADPFSSLILSDSLANITKASDNLANNSISSSSDPMQKALKAYQGYQNASNDTGNNLDEVA